MRNPQFILNLAAKLVIVFFAGAGGSCTGVEAAIERHVDYAVNHSDNALSCHRANHPQTQHLVENVWQVDPRRLTGGQRAGYIHFSPDCTHFSQAKGGQPRDRATRSLSWVVVKWTGTVQPDVITLENVEAIRRWCPLIAKRDKATGRVVKLDGSVAAPGEQVPLRQQFLIPDPKRAGQTWRRFLAILRSHGYVVEDRMLCAADYGVPTTRTRLFLIARRDGRPIVWPSPTHFKNPQKGQKRWVAAHTCIDWNIPSRSIFQREKPLAPATMRRIAIGMKKFVLDSGDPFIVPIANWSRETVHDIRQPLGTITAWPKGGHFALVSAFVEQANGGFNTSVAQDVRRPLTTVTTTGAQQRLVTAALAHLRTNCDARDVREPLRTISAGGEHHALVEYHLSPDAEAGALRCAAFLMQYYSEGGQWSDLRDPLNTITTRDRLALVTIWLRGEPYVVVDICLRMLTPRELANASGFPPQYILTHGHDGRIFTKAQQVFHIGNAVPPPLQQAVTSVNYSDLPAPESLRRAA